MRMQIRSRNLFFGLLVPIILQLFSLATPKEKDELATPLMPDIVGCAGTDATVFYCTFCTDLDMVIDLLDNLNGSPRTGGTWTDLDNSGLDISDPFQVDISSLGTGIYRFEYATSAGGACPADVAVLSLNITGANTIACVDQIDAILGSDCTFELTVENILAGSTVCEDELSVLAFDFRTGFNGDVLNSEHVGRILDVVLFREGCAQPICNSTILLEDKGRPELSNIDWRADQITLYCEDLDIFINNEKSWNDPTYKYYLGGPLINECSGFQVAVTDNVVYEPCQSEVYARLLRTFIITDAAGNFSSTTLEAEFIYPEIDKIAKLPDIVINNCDPNSVPIPATYPYLINSFGDTIYLKEDGCDYSIGFEDRDFTVCGGSKKVEREIRYFDWCTDEFFPIDTLVIKIGDFSGPIIQRNVDTAVIRTSAFSCGGAISFRKTDLEILFDIQIDECNTSDIGIIGRVESWLPEVDYVDSSYQRGEAIHHENYIDNIPAGLHRFIVTLSDGCKAEATDTLYFRVEDRTPPVMACIDRLLVAMSEGPYGKISYIDINEGSSDNCEIISFKVRRKVPSSSHEYYDYDGDGVVIGEELDEEGFTLFDDQRSNGDYVEYYCNDLLQPEQQIELWAWDKDGNKSTCWANILLEDKIPPVCIAPEDTTILCYEYFPPDLTYFGEAIPSDYTCGDIVVEELTPIDSRDQCGNGQLIRQFQAIKNPDTDFPRVGPVCLQTITIENIQDYAICFPADTTLDCGLLLDEIQPLIEENGCALFAVSQEDIRLEAENDACYKIIRTYSLINWCEYQPDDPFVHIDRDVDGDGLPGDEGICVVVRTDSATYLDVNTNPRDTFPNQRGYWQSSNANPNVASTGYWKYTQHIQVRDTTPPQLSFPDTLVFESRYMASVEGCFGIGEIPFFIEETCDSFINLEISLDLEAKGTDIIPLGEEFLFGNFPDYYVMTDFPVGNHELRVEANDGCGNTAYIAIPFEVIDKKAPAPICNDRLVVEMSYFENNGELEAFASARVDALLASPVYDCNGQGPDGLITDYSINRVGSTVVRGQRELFFDCADVNMFIPVAVYAWDEAGNNDYCTTFIQIQDNNAVCERLANVGVISGNIQTPEGRMVENVMVELSGEEDAFYATGSSGDYLFEALPSGKNYTIRPAKNDDIKNGVSTLDLIKVQKHVLGGALITDPYRLIAADINNSKSVSTLDMIQLRKIILNVEGSFKNNTSWRFVEANYQFPDDTNPWLENFPESIQLEEMQGPEDVRFIGIKIGDVNASAVANHIDGATIGRNAGQLDLQIHEESLTKGEVVAVPIRVADLAEVEGFQGTLSFHTDKLTFLTMNYGLLEAGEIGYFEGGNHMSFSWNRSGSKQEVDNQVLMTVYFKAKKNVFLSNAIELSSLHTRSEAYTVFGEQMDLNLVFENQDSEEYHWKLFSNQPNPFRELTTFPFFLDESQVLKMEIYDLMGRKIWSNESNWEAGLQTLQLSAAIFPAKGIYYFRMQVGKEQVTKTLLLE